MKPRLQSMIAASAALAAVALASAPVAQADGMERAAPAATYAPAYSWTGLYIGVQDGWLNGEIKGHFLPPNQAFRFKAEPDGDIAGIHIGYQYQWSNIVLGVEGNLSSDVLTEESEGRVRGGGLGGSCGFVATVESCNGRIYSIRDVGPRLGLAKDVWMAYVTGGYAEARINTWGTHVPVASPSFRFSEGSNTHDGWFAGLGADYALSKNAIVGFEWKHYEFDDSNHLVPVVTDDRKVHADADAFLLRMDFKFDYQRTPAPLK